MAVVATVTAAAPVDPFLGTGGHGHTHPAATLPFGMVQLGPDTRLSGWDGCSGYHFTDDRLYGFSHTHLSGTGIADYCDVLFLPVVDGAGVRAALTADPETTFAVPFDKATETAGPGWYSVTLPGEDVRVELTATLRTGVHRYTFPDGAPARLLIDLAHRDRVTKSFFRLAGESEIEGLRRSTGWAKDQAVWFVARFSRPIADVFSRQTAGGGGKVLLTFGGEGRELIATVGLSGTDMDGARRNLDAEAGGSPCSDVFDQARSRAGRTWADALDVIHVEGGTSEQRTVFTTALYHCLLTPNTWSDADGRYLGMDRAVHGTDGVRYTVFSLWDTFRALHPLLTWIDPDRTRDFVRTMVGMAQEGGRLPVWELAANETDTMIGYHAVPVIADAWEKGVRGFDADAALDAMVASASGDRFGLDDYRRHGFVSADRGSESVSRTLEYAYDDWCIAEMAGSLGRTEVEAEFRRRAQAWRHLLDPETGFFRARQDQRFVEPFDPARVDFHYTEANAWQYAFFVPHDVEGLMEALGGDEGFVRRLDGLFSADTVTTGRDQADITGLLGQYAHGNEPSHHIAWLYHYAGRPDLSAARVREIRNRFYRAAPDGLAGNEDCGQMSAWYVLAAMGLYSVCPGSKEWLIGVPAFDRVRVRLPTGGVFEIVTQGEGDLITDARLNGEPLTRSFLRHDEIARPGTLVLTLGPEPAGWGTAPEDRPRSRGGGQRVPAAPFVRAPTGPFRDSVSVAIACADADAAVRWAREEELDTVWHAYDAPLTFREPTSIRMVSERAGVRSPVVRATFLPVLHDWKITLGSDPAPQYSADGAASLVDGRRGALDWRTGSWLGWQGEDLVATVDLGEVRPIARAGAGFLQDVRSWIWMPSRVSVSVSRDGSEFREMARIQSPLSARDEEVARRELTADLGDEEARFVRIRATSYGEIPAWHLGAGGDAWIFVDELVIE